MKPTRFTPCDPLPWLLALLLSLLPALAADEAAIQAEIEAVRKAGLAQWKDRLPDNFESYVRDTGRRNYYQRAFNTALTNGNAAALAVVFKEFPEFARTNHLNGSVVQGKSALHYAVERGHREVVRLLLAQKVGADAPRPASVGFVGASPFGPSGMRFPPGYQERRDTPLHLAVRAANLELVELLLQAGADREALDSRSESPLYISVRQLSGPLGSSGALPPGSDARERQESIITRLLQHGAQVLTTNRFGFNQPLATVLQSRNEALLDQFLTNCVHRAATNNAGDTLAHLAVTQGRTNALRVLLGHRPPLAAANAAGFTPLRQAAWLVPVAQLPAPSYYRSGYAVVDPGARAAFLRQHSANLLLAAGAVPDAFALAGLNRTNELAALLKREPAQASARDPLDRSPLHYAVNASATAALQILIEAKSATEARDRSGQTPLLQALLQRRFPEATRLLAAGASVAATNNSGQTALHLAVANGGDTNLLALLVAARADVNARDAAHKTPLELAAVHQRFDLVQWLEAGGAAVIAPKLRLMTTPLHQAVAQGNLLAASNQLALRADVNVRNEQGLTPLALAVGAGRVDIATLLLTNGADVNLPDTNGVTPLRARIIAAKDPVPDPLPKPGFSKRRPVSVAAKTTTTRANSLPPEFRPASQPGQPPLSNLLLLLLERGANAKLLDLKGNTILHALQPPPPDYSHPPRPKTVLIPEAVSRVRLLAAYGLAPDTRATNGLTALHQMAAQADFIHAFALLEAGAGVNTPDAQGRTALHHVLAPKLNPATWQHHADGRMAFTHTVALLLDNGADLRRADTNGATPLHLLPAMDGALRDLLLPVLRTNRHFPAALRVRNKAGQTPVTQVLDQLRAKPVTAHAQLLSTLVAAGGELPAANASGGATLLHDFAGMSLVGHDFFGPSQPDPALTAVLQRIASNVVARAANVDVRNAKGETPLHMATQLRNAPYAAALLARGANPNAPDANGDTPMHLAVRSVNPNTGYQHAVIPLLLSNRCDLARRNQQGETALRFAVSQFFYHPPLFLPPGATRSFYSAILEDDRVSLEAYLKLDASLATLSAPISPLRIAAQSGHMALAERFRAAGATDPLAAVLLGWTDSLAASVHLTPALGASRLLPGLPLLHSAVMRGQLAAAQLLVTPEAPADLTDVWGRTALYHATTNTETGAPLLMWLRSRGVAMSMFDALWLGDEARLAELLANDPALVKATNSLGMTPLLAAVERGIPALVRRLVAARAEVNRPLVGAGIPVVMEMQPGTVPLHLAAWSNRVDLAELLTGASVNATNASGYTALHLAAARGHTEFVQWLLARGADANFVRIAPLHSMHPTTRYYSPDDGWTPLHAAARHARPATIELLVKHGAKLEATDKQGLTPAGVLASGSSRGFGVWAPTPYRGFSAIVGAELRPDAGRVAEALEVLRKLGAIVPTTPGAMILNRGLPPGFAPPPNLLTPPPGVVPLPKR